MKKHYRFFPNMTALTNMKRLYAVAVTVFLSIFLVAAADAAPTAKSNTADVPLGIQNSKKVMTYRVERNKKMHDMQDKAHGKKVEAQSGK